MEEIYHVGSNVKVITRRMYFICPTELFNLSIITHSIITKGSYKFQWFKNYKWRSMSGILVAYLGLIKDDDEWKRAMNEAIGWISRQLHRLFVRILLHCQPLHPEELWENFKVALSEDYVRHFGLL